MTLAAGTSYLNLCAQDAQAGGAAVVLDPDGKERSLLVAAQPAAGCAHLALPVPATAVRGLLAVSSDAAAGMQRGVLVHGAHNDDRFAFSEAVPLGQEAGETRGPATPPVPFDTDLLPQLQWRAYGVEERARAQRVADGLLLQCAPGSAPAGIVLHGDWVLPRARLALQIAGRATAAFTVAAIDAARAQREDALVLGTFAASPNSSATLPLAPDRFDGAQWRGLAIACPGQGGQLRLESLRVALEAQSAAPPRAGWVWRPDGWQNRPQQVFAHAQRHGIRVLFVTVPVRSGAVADPEGLQDFVRGAHARGMAVWSVDGDPRMVLPGERGAALERVRAYRHYNRAAPPDARLAGMQFDVEHYLLPGYSLSASAFDRHYVALIEALRQVAGEMPLDFVVPFWWSGKETLLEALARADGSLTVMDYRTARDEILRHAMPFLDWGVRHQRPVRIALEAGPVDSEEQWRFTSAPAGTLWLVQVGDLHVLLMLDHARPNPFGPAFALAGVRTLDGSATTFAADPSRLLRMLPTLEAELSAWKSYAGLALHELD